jgi:predicted small lipoprotein YifL
VRRLLALGAVAIVSVFTLSACGQQGGLDLARQACVHVNRSLADYAQSTRPGTPAARRAQLSAKAAAELRAALPLAASANSDDGSWNALMTDISETATVDEAHLAPSLKAQCLMATTNVNVNPQNGNPQNVNPQNVNPAGSTGSQ